LQGLFYVPGAPELPKGAMVDGNPTGDPLDVKGKIHDPKGRPIANALIDVWQAGEDGLYSSQDPNKQKYELRGKFRSDHDGSYHFRSVLPKGLSDPDRRTGGCADAGDTPIDLAAGASSFHALGRGLQDADDASLRQGHAALEWPRFGGQVLN
jgi:protocatechuate 3,4-dioxygenase beta subunit